MFWRSQKATIFFFLWKIDFIFLSLHISWFLKLSRFGPHLCMLVCIKMNITHSTSFSSAYFFLIFSYLICKYIQLFRHPCTEGLVFQPKLLQGCFQRACISSVKERKKFWGIYPQMQHTCHDFKLLQCKRNVLSSFTTSSHKGSSGRISHVGAEDTNLSMYIYV